MGTWQITYGGVTQDASAWGIEKVTRKRKSAETDIVTFSLGGTAMDTHPLPFTYKQPLAITRNGLPWFSGIVTKPVGKGAAKAESIDYEISGPWIVLEKTPFQQQWVTCSISGSALVTLTTTRSSVILGQSLDATKMNSGQVINEVLLFAQYAAQLLPFPTAVAANHLPAPPPTPGPFQIGTITPNVMVPYTQLRDKSCADIIRLMLKYSPDCVATFDYSTSPPTLNIASQSAMAARAKTIQAYGSSARNFTAAPRYDLQVPVVVLKFEQKNSSNGQTLDMTTVQSYPPAPAGVDQGAWESQPWAWVQTIDLIGSQTTQQTAAVNTTARPIAYNDEVALPWALARPPLAWLTQAPPAGATSGFGSSGGAFEWLYDVPNVSVAAIATTIDPNDPLNASNLPGATVTAEECNPNNITLPGCPQLVNQLLSPFPAWLQEDPNNLDAANVVITIDLKYAGSDPATAKFFWFDPTNPNVPKTDGSGVLRVYYGCKVTNADSTTYSQLTSWDAQEPVPPGMAQALYNAACPLYFQGSLDWVEAECSDPLPPGCVFNTVDGSPDWQTMNAVVLAVTEDLDKGTTKIEFGPPHVLDAEEMEELFRAQLGRLPSFKLQQRTTGKLTAGANVTGDRHAADTSSAMVPGGGGAGEQPYDVLDASSGSTPKITVIPGMHNDSVVPTIGGNPINVKIGSPPAFPSLTLQAGDTRVYFKIDYNEGGVPVTIEIDRCNEAGWASLISGINIQAGVAGTDYKTLTTLSIGTLANGNAKVTPNNDSVTGPQQYIQCGNNSYSFNPYVAA